MSSGATRTPSEGMTGAAQEQRQNEAGMGVAVLGPAISRGAVLLFGSVSLVVGLMVILWPDVTIGVVAVLFGIHLLVHGVYRILQSVTATGAGGGVRMLMAVVGLLSIAVGVLCMRDLMQTVAVLALLLGLFWLVGGITEVIDAIAHRATPNRGLAITSGVLGALAGVVVLAWPGITVFVLTFLLGAWLIVLGLIALVMGLRSRPANQPAGQASQPAGRAS